jgi:hypothetical protein
LCPCGILLLHGVSEVCAGWRFSQGWPPPRDHTRSNCSTSQPHNVIDADTDRLDRGIVPSGCKKLGIVSDASCIYERWLSLPTLQVVVSAAPSHLLTPRDSSLATRTPRIFYSLKAFKFSNTFWQLLARCHYSHVSRSGQLVLQAGHGMPAVLEREYRVPQRS